VRAPEDGDSLVSRRDRGPLDAGRAGKIEERRRGSLLGDADQLPEQERLVSRYYYEHMTLPDRAQLGISESRVSQVHSRP